MPAKERWRTVGHLTTLFLVALGLRLLFFQGCILGDDPNDIGAVQAVLARSPHFTVHWELRIFLWFFIALAQKALGVSEWSLFLSTCMFSKIKTGTYFPFLETVKIGLISAPVAPADLWRTFALYPTMIFRGSE